MNGRTHDPHAQPSGPARAGGLPALLQRRWVLMAGVLGAAALLLLGLLPQSAPSGGDEPAAAVGALDAAQYEQRLEQRLAQLIAQVEGAGDVTVMVLLESTGQTVYAQAHQETSDTATDPAAGSSARSSRASDYVLVEDGAGRYALTETTLLPAVRGVAVVCEGAGDIRVVSRITQLVSTVLGLPSNRICVTN